MGREEVSSTDREGQRMAGGRQRWITQARATETALGVMCCASPYLALMLGDGGAAIGLLGDWGSPGREGVDTEHPPISTVSPP